MDRQTRENPKVFRTQFGKFISDNQGEFGGQLQTPHTVVGGNFRDVFDYEDKVYAVDSLEHMTMGNTTLYEVSQDGSMNVIYDVGYSFWMEENDAEEEMGYRIKYVGEALYIMIAGVVVNRAIHELRYESRILKIEDNEIKEVYVIPEIYGEVPDLIVYNDTAYIAADKMLSVVNLQTMESKYYTFLSSKALHNLRKHNKEKK